MIFPVLFPAFNPPVCLLSILDTLYSITTEIHYYLNSTNYTIDKSTTVAHYPIHCADNVCSSMHPVSRAFPPEWKQTSDIPHQWSNVENNGEILGKSATWDLNTQVLLAKKNKNTSVACFKLAKAKACVSKYCGKTNDIKTATIE